MESKFCKYCNKDHSLTTEFWSRLESYPKCKKRVSDYMKKRYDPEKQSKYNKQYRKKNRERLNEKNKKWREENRERHRTTSLEYYYNNKETVIKKNTERQKARRKTDVCYQLTCNLRGRMYRVMRGINKTGSAVKDLGCSKEQLKLYLENQFHSGMTWENYGQTWEIDHVIPLASFDLENRGEYQTAAHYLNLQPMLISDNRSKKDSTHTTI